MSEGDQLTVDGSPMLRRFCDLILRVLDTVCWIMFAALIAVVALQVLARNVLYLALIWTADLAQMLFVWLVFLGAAAALRRGMHYTVDMFSKNARLLNVALEWLGIAAGLVVAYILIVHGWTLTMIRSTGVIQSLDVSSFWMYLPIPLSGLLMLIFLIEAASGLLSRRPQ